MLSAVRNPFDQALEIAKCDLKPERAAVEELP
jgi:hypothetical protein